MRAGRTIKMGARLIIAACLLDRATVRRRGRSCGIERTYFDTINVEDLHGTHVGVSTCDIILVLGEHDIWTLVWRGKLTRKEILVWTL